MTIQERKNLSQDGGSSPAVRDVQGHGRRRFLKTLVASGIGIFLVARALHAGGPGSGGGGGGGGGGPKPANPLLGSWFSPITPINTNFTFPTVVTFNSTGQFTWVQTNPLTGQVLTVQGSYTLGPLAPTGETYLTLVSQGQIGFQGLFAQPGPGEFIIETFTTWPLVGGPDFFLFSRQ